MYLIRIGRAEFTGDFRSGTKHDDPQERKSKLGSVYSFGQNRVLQLILNNLSTVTGGFAWFPRPAKEKDKKAPPVKFYFADTVKNEIVLYDALQNRYQAIKNPQKLFSLPHHGLNGNPGRTAIDDKGCLWVPLIGGYGVIEFDPVTKETDRLISLPAAKVGECTFGGPDMDILYVSTIGYEYKISREYRTKADLGGYIFAIRGLQVREIPTREFNVIPTGLPDAIRRSRENTDRERLRAAHRKSGSSRAAKAARVEI
ncbi:putative sugar lactone lactonase YvrE [Belonocnema kinseyi]|uniref:putative sugar lactone lactonase YvrE n=1 Tax=Belonocnema kinseyi TaxID=2817044 RepID=UPI00143DB1F2|nr:putative sugar lactone lactonase YvrE [Belonocnema kinseyi]